MILKSTYYYPNLYQKQINGELREAIIKGTINSSKSERYFNNPDLILLDPCVQGLDILNTGIVKNYSEIPAGIFVRYKKDEKDIIVGIWLFE